MPESSLLVVSLLAFVGGVVSFLSPCVLPLVPGYVSLISGSSVDEMRQSGRGVNRKLMLNSLMFILGFSVVFIGLGAVATTFGQLLSAYKRELTLIAGFIVIVFGLHLLGVFRIKYLYADKRFHSLKGRATAGGAFLVGFAFAFGWTPCIGPILAMVLTMASVQETVMRGVVLLAIYSAGLAVPFLLTSLGVDRFFSIYTRVRRHFRAVEVVSGVLLIAVGLLIAFDKLTMFNTYFGFMNDVVISIEKRLL
jgi:cytochrome c-type biogenesis protein